MGGFSMMILGLIVGGGAAFFAICCLQVARDKDVRADLNDASPPANDKGASD